MWFLFYKFEQAYLNIPQGCLCGNKTMNPNKELK